MSWARMLSFITGSVDQELLLRDEFLIAENRILRARIKGKPRLTDPERITLAEIGKRLGRKALAKVCSLVKPDTILGWHRKLIAGKFDGSKHRSYPARPPISKKVQDLVCKLARENRSWGYDRISGALANLDHDVPDITIGNILRRNGIPPAPERKKSTTWKEFIRTHMDVLAATDFFTTEVWTKFGLTTYYVLFFIHLGSRKVHIAGITPYPEESWMQQVARNLTMQDWGFLRALPQPCRFLIHDRDAKFTESFRGILEASGIKTIRLPPKSPNLNAFAERWVRSVKEECLGKLILFGERSLQHVLDEYVEHFQRERNHQGMGNLLLMPDPEDRVGSRDGRMECRERLGGMLRFYHREAA